MISEKPTNLQGSETSHVFNPKKILLLHKLEVSELVVTSNTKINGLENRGRVVVVILL